MSLDSQVQGLPPALDVIGATARITLRRPQKMNKLTAVDLRVLQSHCEQIDADQSIRVVVLSADTTGQKKPVFCAGFDVDGFDADEHDPRLFEQTIDRLAELRPVLICALNGSVFGGATDMVLASDLRIGLSDLVFKMPALSLGLHYYPSGMKRYVQSFGLERARQAFLSARPFSAEQLQTFGILMEIHGQDVFNEALAKLVQEVAALAPLAAQLTKRSLAEIASEDADMAQLRARELLCLQSSDFAEGRTAFAERRVRQVKAAWPGAQVKPAVL